MEGNKQDLCSVDSMNDAIHLNVLSCFAIVHFCISPNHVSELGQKFVIQLNTDAPDDTNNNIL